MKRDYKRYMKNFLLIFLISLSFFLTFRLWSVGNYFGTGLKDTFGNIIDAFKDPVVSLFRGMGDDSSSQNLKFVLSPKRIVANYADKRSIMNNDDADFLRFYEETIEILKDIEAGETEIKSVENVSENDYYAALKGKSVLIDFDSKYDYNLFGVVTGVSGESKLMKESAVVREFIISMPENVLNYTTLYIMDYSDDTVYKFLLDMDKADIEDLVQKRLSKDTLSGTYFYSYELNFHVEENADGSPVKVVFEPLSSVNLMPEERTGISAGRYTSDSEETINESELLKKFNINAVSAGQYTDIDGSRNFVEKNATLKIGTDGYIEYVSAEGGKGIKISDEEENSAFDIGLATTVTSEFVADVFELLPESEDDSLRITGDLTEGASPGKYRICYDYYIGGLPVFQLDGSTNLITNSVVAEVENGYITYYKHYIRTYEYTEEETVQETMITAADALVSKMADDGGQMRINKAYECFIDTGAGEPEADWVFEIDGLGGLYR